MFTKEFIKNLAGPPKSITKCPEFKKMAPQRIAEGSDGDRAKGNCQREREREKYIYSISLEQYG